MYVYMHASRGYACTPRSSCWITRKVCIKLLVEAHPVNINDLPAQGPLLPSLAHEDDTNQCWFNAGPL